MGAKTFFFGDHFFEAQFFAPPKRDSPLPQNNALVAALQQDPSLSLDQVNKNVVTIREFFAFALISFV